MSKPISVECCGLAPKLVPGRNKDAAPDATPIACSHTNLGAHGHANHVVVIDLLSAQVLQTLVAHKSTVTALRWKRASPSLATNNVELLSGDSSGVVCLWDVGEGLVLRSMKVANTAITAIVLDGQYCRVVCSNGSIVSIDAELTSSVEKKVETSRGVIPLVACRSTFVGPNLAVALLFRTSACVKVFTRSEMPGAEVATHVIPMEPEENHVDGYFSTTHPELLYVATASTLCVYDWTLFLPIRSNLVWRPGDQGFVRVFPGADAMMNGDGPRTFSLTADGKLSSWYCSEGSAPQATSVDVRGHRLSNRPVGSVEQLSNRVDSFVVLFTDGSVALWRFHTDEDAWELQGFIEAQAASTREIAALDASTVCRGSDCIAVEVHDVLHNRIERKFNVLQGSNTTVSCILPHSPTRVWLVLTKTLQGKHFTQVLLFDVSVGEVEYILRPLPSHADPGNFLGASTDESSSYLLLTFETNAFEVWSIRTRAMIHVRMGYNLAFVAWGPPGVSLNAAWTNTSLLATMLGEGGVQFFAIHDDHLTGLKETYPLRLVNGDGTVSHVCATGDMLICFDSLGGGSILRCLPHKEKWKWGILQQFPRTTVLLCTPHVADNKTKICVVFVDGSFGTWDLETRAKIGFSGDGDLHLRAARSVWLTSSLLAVLCADGNMAVVDEECSSCNSSFFSKTIARVMRSPAFLLPAHSAFLQTSLEWFAPSDEKCGWLSPDADVEPSFISRNAAADPPYRTPFGQLVGQKLTLAAELRLHFQIVPADVLEDLEEAARQRDWAKTAQITARFFGQHEKEHLWTAMRTNAAPTDPAPQLRATVSKAAAHSTLLRPCGTVRAERLALAKERMAAIQSQQGHHIDDSQARLAISRSLITLGLLQEACDILIDSPFEFDSYSNNANLACSIAGSINVKKGEALVVVTKRAAAMLLAKGDVDAAVEKFSLIGEFYEAALALQSRGRWYDAALLAMTAPMSASSRVELQQRWALHEARKGNTMFAAQMLASIGASVQALVLLCESAGNTGTAGTLAAVLATTGVLDEKSCRACVASPSRTDDDTETPPLVETIEAALSGLHAMLSAVHNDTAAAKAANVASTFGIDVHTAE